MVSKRSAPPSFGIFAEGAPVTDPRSRRDTFRDLWQELCARCGRTTPDRIHVFGISKAQIVSLKDDVGTKRPDREPLDLLIQRMHARHGFDVAIIAFDRIPRNQYVPHDCMRSEVDFVLGRLHKRKLLPVPMLKAAGRLLKHYEQQPRKPRGAGHPPRECLNVVYMDPMFEGLLVADERTVLRALGHKTRPKDWPRFNQNERQPVENILRHAVELAEPAVRRRIHGNMKTNRHGWASQIVRTAQPDAPLFQHEIALRLRTVLA